MSWWLLRCPFFNKFPNWSGAPDEGCSQFCSCQNLALPQAFVGPEFSVLNLKSFQEEYPVDPLASNLSLQGTN